MLVALVLSNVLGAATFVASAHVLWMRVLRLEDTVMRDNTRYKLACLFVFDGVSALLCIIGLSVAFSSLFVLCVPDEGMQVNDGDS